MDFDLSGLIKPPKTQVNTREFIAPMICRLARTRKDHKKGSNVLPITLRKIRSDEISQLELELEVGSFPDGRPIRISSGS